MGDILQKNKGFPKFIQGNPSIAFDLQN